MTWLRRVMAVLLPWPPRHQREAAVAAARRQKEVSQRGAAHAAGIGRDIERMTEQNGFAQLIAAQIMAGRRREDP